MPVQVQCTMLDAWDWCTGTTQRDGMGREEGGGFRMDFLLKIKKKKEMMESVFSVSSTSYYVAVDIALIS